MSSTRATYVEEDLWWKTIFSERQPSVEDDIGGRQTLVEDKLWWKTNFGGRRPSVEDDLQWKNLWCKTTFSGRRPLAVNPPLDSDIRTEPNPKQLSDIVEKFMQ